VRFSTSVPDYTGAPVEGSRSSPGVPVKIAPCRAEVAVERRDNFVHQECRNFSLGVDAFCCAARQLAALQNGIRE